MNIISIGSLLIIGGFAIFVLGSPYYSIFPTNRNKVYYLFLTGFIFTIAMLFRLNQATEKYWQAAYALFIAAAALLFLSTGIFNIKQTGLSQIQLIAVDKLSQFLHIVPVIIVLTLLAGRDLASIFISAGKLWQTLIFGVVSFVCFGVVAFATGGLGSSVLPKLRTALPWLALFIFANAILEELWFRGIFLRPYSILIGQTGAILVTAVIFGASHINATYSFPGGGIVFGLVVFGLGLVGALTMINNGSLIGPVLFHAGYDLLVIAPILKSL